MKNIIALAILALCNVCVAQEVVNLFNGNNLNGWRFHLEDKNVKPSDVFIVKSGVLHITGKPYGYMYTEKRYDNFRLHVEWCYPVESTNSGIFLFVQDPAAIWPNTIECQLMRFRAGDLVLLGGSYVDEFKKIPTDQKTKFPVIRKMVESKEFPAGKWNTADIICEEGNITVYINGVLQNKATNATHRSGYIALQSEGGDILFRNVRLTPIK